MEKRAHQKEKAKLVCVMTTRTHIGSDRVGWDTPFAPGETFPFCQETLSSQGKGQSLKQSGRSEGRPGRVGPGRDRGPGRACLLQSGDVEQGLTPSLGGPFLQGGRCAS